MDPNGLQYRYDLAGNRLAEIDNGDRTTSVYDAAGNQRSIEAPSGDLTTTTWDAENQTIVVELPSEALVTYTWNADFKRVGKDDGIDQTVYVWDQNHLLVETDELSVPLVQYTNEPDEYGNLVSQNRDSASSFYHYDHQQSTRALTDGSEVVTDDYTYEAFGETIDSTGSTANPYQWVGQLGYYLPTHLQ